MQFRRRTVFLTLILVVIFFTGLLLLSQHKLGTIPQKKTTSSFNLLRHRGCKPLTAFNRPPGKRIAILTIVVPPTSFFGQRSLSQYHLETVLNKYQYANLHGYDFIPITEPLNDEEGLPVVWDKIDSLKYYLECGNYDWIWYLDSDAFIINPELTVEDHVLSQLPYPSENYDIIANKDHRGFNAGSFFLRNTNLTISFLDDIWSRRNEPKYRNHGFQEQLAMIDIFEENATVQEKTFWIPQRRINSYGYRKGEFVIHFAGNRKKDEAFQWLRDTMEEAERNAAR